MEISVKKFEELTKRELYEVLKARCRVFVVEQACPYLDPDWEGLLRLITFWHRKTGKLRPI